MRLFEYEDQIHVGQPRRDVDLLACAVLMYACAGIQRMKGLLDGPDFLCGQPQTNLMVHGSSVIAVERRRRLRRRPERTYLVTTSLPFIIVE